MEADGIKNPVAEAFRAIRPNNPLSKLDDSDRKFLWASLMMYAEAATRRRKRDAVLDGLERLSRIVAAAAKAAEKLELEVFRGPFSEQLRTLIVGYEDLPIRFKRLTKELEQALDSTGKPGHKRRTLATGFLIQASEFVRLKTNQPHDGYLVELFQVIEKNSLSKKMCDDTIRKKREYLKKHNPLAYSRALKAARSRCNMPLA